MSNWCQGHFFFSSHISSSILNYSIKIFKYLAHGEYTGKYEFNSFSIRKFCWKSVSCFQSHFHNGNWFLFLIWLNGKEDQVLELSDRISTQFAGTLASWWWNCQNYTNEKGMLWLDALLNVNYVVRKIESLYSDMKFLVGYNGFIKARKSS